LQSLHRITDPKETHQLLSVNTADDRTLFFDLLPFDLGTILGYKVAIKVYTVPGQVRYEATRRVVLAGADAVVFVADSSRDRKEDTESALASLRENMEANGLNPSNVPVFYQYNKQDLPDAAEPAEVASWVGVDPGVGFPAVATEDLGVLETFMAATRAMLDRLVSLADEPTRRALDVEDLGRQVEKAFGPHLRRRSVPKAASPARASSPGDEDSGQITIEGDDLVEQSVTASLRLGDDLAQSRALARRLEREADAYRRLTDTIRRMGASFERDAMLDAVLDSVADVLGAAAVSLVRKKEDGALAVERSWQGRKDPLAQFPEGRVHLMRMMKTRKPCLIDDLPAEMSSRHAPPEIERLRAVAAAPVEGAGLRTLVAYSPGADETYDEQDVRFLATVASHLTVGLEQTRLYGELERQRDHLEELVRARTEALRQALEDLRGLDQMKDRFISGVSHEMKSPLTAILGATSFLKEYEGNPASRAEMTESILESSRALEAMVENLLRLANLNEGDLELDLDTCTPREIVREALQLAGRTGVQVRIHKQVQPVQADLAKLARAVADLVDNAVKFSPEGSPVEVRVIPAKIRQGEAELPGVAFSVLDRGPGVREEDTERIFAPFEQGGDSLTEKPRGFGIGLWEARSIARGHGGRLRFVPREGGGSEFRLVVPVEIVPVPEREAEPVGAVETRNET
ncbi:MAG: ATP-binding protein, partial [Acidobacteriota bacterium]|nr:ATP-binding protein [Acidobacteriota bacterium]